MEEEGAEMEEEKGCPLFRKAESLGLGKGVGYCDLDGKSTDCDGDTKVCKNTDALKQYLQKRKDQFEKKRVSSGSSSGKSLEMKSIGTPTQTPLSLEKGKIAGLNAPDERRQHPRYLVKLPVVLWQTPEAVKKGIVVDISEKGLGIESTQEIQIGTELKIRIYLSKEEHRFDSIEGTGRIIWRTVHQEQQWKRFKYGLSILQMPSDSRTRLLKYIFMVQKGQNLSH